MCWRLTPSIVCTIFKKKVTALMPKNNHARGMKANISCIELFAAICGVERLKASRQPMPSRKKIKDVRKCRSRVNIKPFFVASVPLRTEHDSKSSISLTFFSKKTATLHDAWVAADSFSVLIDDHQSLYVDTLSLSCVA